jgi:hypothetical protein
MIRHSYRRFEAVLGGGIGQILPKSPPNHHLTPVYPKNLRNAILFGSNLEDIGPNPENFKKTHPLQRGFGVLTGRKNAV